MSQQSLQKLNCSAHCGMASENYCAGKGSAPASQLQRDVDVMWFVMYENATAPPTSPSKPLPIHALFASTMAITSSNPNW